jgi:hypothetical protein
MDPHMGAVRWFSPLWMRAVAPVHVGSNVKPLLHGYLTLHKIISHCCGMKSNPSAAISASCYQALRFYACESRVGKSQLNLIQSIHHWNAFIAGLQIRSAITIIQLIMALNTLIAGFQFRFSMIRVIHLIMVVNKLIDRFQLSLATKTIQLISIIDLICHWIHWLQGFKLAP